MLTIFLFCVLIFAKAQNAVSSAQEEQSGAPNIYTETDESRLLLDNTGSSGTSLASQGGRRSYVGTYIAVILFLVAFIALAWGVRRLLKRNSVGITEDDTFLRRVASLSLGGGKSVQIVTLLDEAFLLGVSENSVQFLSKIEDKELVNAMNVYADKNGKTARPKSFADVLDLFVPKKAQAQTQVQGEEKRQSENVFEDGSSQKILDSIKRQSKRLSGEE